MAHASAFRPRGGTFFTLLAMQVRQRLGISLWSSKGAKRPGRVLARNIAIGAGITVLALYLEGLYCFVMYHFARVMRDARMLEFLPLAGLLAAQACALALGCGLLISLLYFGNDAEALRSLPVKPGTVFATKFAQALGGELAASIPFLWPPLILYGVFAQPGAGYWVRALFVWLMVISLPMLLSALIAIPVMRLSVIWKHRDQATIVLSLLLLGLYIGAQSYLTNKIPSMLDSSAVLLWVSGQRAWMSRLTDRIFPFNIEMRALTGGGSGAWPNLLLLALAAAAAMAAVYWLASKLYQKGVQAQQETGSDVKPTDFARLKVRRSRPVSALMRREWLLLLRTPVYVLNCLATIVLLPVMMLLPVLGSTAMMNEPEMQALMRMLYAYTDGPMLSLIAAGFIAIAGAMSMTPGTSVSREGTQYFWLRALPVSPRTVALAKLGLSVILTWIGGILMLGSLVFLLKLPLVPVLRGFWLGLLACVPMCAFPLAVDFSMPKLVWSNPTAAVKQNKNGMLGMLANVVMLTGLGFLAYWLNKLAPAAGLFWVITGLVFLIALVSLCVLDRAAASALRRVDG